MKGKKIDTEFLSYFIQECILLGITNSEDIVDKAKLIINDIDFAIIEIEKQKIKRSKLLSVVESLQNSGKNSKKDEAKLLPFFDISNPEICKNICEGLKIGIVYLNTDLDVIFCVKQMIKFKIAKKVGDHLICGDMFDEYLKFTEKEV